MSTSLTRRQIAKGAAWAAPVVAATAAVPAYAASPAPQYYIGKSVTANYIRTGCTINQFYLSTSVPVSPEVAGFSVGHIGNTTVGDTTATLSGLTFTFAVPRGMVNNPTVDNPAWTISGPAQQSTLTGRGGSTFNTTNYDIYTLQFNGASTNPVVGENATQTWPGTAFTVTGTSGSYCYSSGTIYSGYNLRSMTLTNGRNQWNNYSNIESRPINQV